MRGGVCMEGCSSWKIDIHLNHKSELSRCLWGGEIIIGLVLDYTLQGWGSCSLQMCVALLHPHPITLSPPHRPTDVHGEILSLRCTEGSVPCRPCARLSGHVLGQINTCVQRVTPCQLHHAVNEEPPSGSWPWGWRVGPASRGARVRFRGVSEPTSPATAISQSAPALFGNGGWRIGLCARIPNNPVYQLVDMLGWKSILSSFSMMEVLLWSPTELQNTTISPCFLVTFE